jgi:hypothetical protein
VVKLKVRKCGNSLGVILSKDVVSRLQTGDGEPLFLIESAEGGNKRTGFVAGILFLELNGYRFTARKREAARAVLELASGNLDKAGYTTFLCANSLPEKK